VKRERRRTVEGDAEIRSLLARLAHTADRGTYEEYIENFVEDAVWQSPDGAAAAGMPASVRRGRDEILAGLRERRDAGLYGPGTATRHVVVPGEIHAGDDGVATARSIFMFYRQSDTTPVLVLMGQYDDEFRKTPDGWKLASRVLVID
jgi:3-phenylpropionate/cinnamic acid dioxygenase small subunit